MSLARREDSLSIADKEQIDRVCLTFEDAWLSGERPVLESFLPTVPNRLQTPLLRELLLVELEFRRSVAEEIRLEEYFVRFPGMEAAIRAANETAARRDCRRQFLPGDLIGRYRVNRLVGSGAFGSIYSAWDSQLEREVAIKVPHADKFSTVRERDRFVREARAVARLRHPGIVDLHDAAQLDDGTVYLVMQFVDGLSLRELLDKGPLHYDKAIRITGDVARAVGAAHRKGVFHRDLKPVNILLDREGQAYVTDFGLALQEKEQDTRAGECAGTLAYMAPEQLRGDSHQTDGRTDIWAIGVMLYEMLTERPPFTGDTREQWSNEILQRDPRPPRQIDSQIPKYAETVCLRCLQKRPADRFATADDVALELSKGSGDSLSNRKWRAFTVVALLMIVGTIGWIPSMRFLERTYTPRNGKVNICIWNPTDSTRQGSQLGLAQVRTLRTGDQVRLDIELDNAGFIYVLWIDSNCVTQPVYPWKRGNWNRRPSNEESFKQLALPNTQNHGWEVGPGKSGMETIVLLARDTPLPKETDLNEILAKLEPVQTENRDIILSYQHGKPLTIENNKDRSPILDKELTIDDPLLLMQRQLVDLLESHFTLISTVTFPFEGDATEENGQEAIGKTPSDQEIVPSAL